MHQDYHDSFVSSEEMSSEETAYDYDNDANTSGKWRFIVLILITIIAAALLVFVVIPFFEQWLNPPPPILPLKPPLQTWLPLQS